MRHRFLAAIIVAISLPLFATEPNPSSRQRELVEKFLDVTKANDAMLTMMDTMFAQMEKQMVGDEEAKGSNPAKIAEAKEIFAEFRQGLSKVDVGGLMHEAYVRIYAKHFTEQELEALIAFYSTPTGRKSIEVLPDLTREGMEAGVRELSPKIEQVMAEVLQAQEKKRPWRRTMSDIRNVATAIESYAIDNDGLYPIGDYTSLKAVLSPQYMKTFPEQDIWGHSYAYIASPDRKRYRLVSAGADSIFDWDSRRIGPEVEDIEEIPVQYRDRLEEDIIYADYTFVQLPVQAKPDDEE
ncbi:MAG TPA: DUF2059 domain-containing protein [Thermoanaerobaculia bacterium]|jgi:hypothetical protein|nr:DUF2059 domain-containing protein [Thermoanaerobaculia bacterium]